METTNNMLLITTADSAVILPTVDRAGKYVVDLMQGMIDAGGPVRLTVQSRPAASVKQFLDGFDRVEKITTQNKGTEAKKEAAPAGKLPKVDKIRAAAPAPKKALKSAGGANLQN
jgi:hypothetical protein